MDSIRFVRSRYNSVGVELELQILDPVSCDLAGRADELLAQFADHAAVDRIKPELTRAMIEINSSVHDHPAGLLAEMRELRDALTHAAAHIGVRVAGGGAHPFMSWRDCDIYDSPRYRRLAELYGYLARQFTVFGQHIHLGVGGGDAAIDLIHRLSPYVPHLVALSASSPYREGVDTLFSCSRLNATHSFPLAGHMPESIRDWYQFEAHYTRMRTLGLVESLKDLYWDIRPKPDLGTVELRVCDTPLTVEKACQLAAFVQALAECVRRDPTPDPLFWLAYDTNRFQAARFGLQAAYVTPTGERMRLLSHLAATFERVMPVADELGTADMVSTLRDEALRLGNDAQWLRTRFQDQPDFRALVNAAADAWRGDPGVGSGSAMGPARRRVRHRASPLTQGMPMLPADLAGSRPEHLH